LDQASRLIHFFLGFSDNIKILYSVVRMPIAMVGSH
jgi:hypothetical protein